MITIMINQNVSAQVVKTLSAHSDLRMINEVYYHGSLEESEKALKQVWGNMLPNKTIDL